MTNRQIAELLRQVAAAYSIRNEAKFHFQILAYQKAADSIENLNIEAYDLYKENRLDSLPGIGKTIKDHLTELFIKGSVKHFKEVTKTIPDAVFVLLNIPSFGPKKAYKLVKKFNLRDPKTAIDDLLDLAKEGKIAGLEGFGKKSQSDIAQALTEYKKGKSKKTRMLLPYANELANRIVSYLKKCKDVQQVYPLGSLRRMVSTIGDIDIAVASNNPKAVVEHFLAFPGKARIIEKGDSSASILTSSEVQIDLMIKPLNNFGSLLQHFTGSKEHNVHLRTLALQKSFSLSEYGIKQTVKGKEKLFTYDSEEKLYKQLGLSFIVPELREDRGEIEAAYSNSLPNLVTLKDIQADLHIHSNYQLQPSHDLGQDSMENMLKKAIKLKYSYLGFSEHNPSIGNHTNNQIYSILAKRQEKIEQLKKSNKYIRVINMLETDILINGDLAIDDKSLSLLDGSIVSIHSSFGMNKEDMTKRVLRGLSHPKAKILAHPTGRLLNQRDGYNLEWNKIFEFCKKYHKALEINAWPERLDLPDTLVKQAVINKVKLVLNTDSHAVSQMDMMFYAVSVARRGWATKYDIINTMEYNEFEKWLKS